MRKIVGDKKPINRLSVGKVLTRIGKFFRTWSTLQVAHRQIIAFSRSLAEQHFRNVAENVAMSVFPRRNPKLDRKSYETKENISDIDS